MYRNIGRFSMVLLSVAPMLFASDSPSKDFILLPSINIIGETNLLDTIPGSGEVIDSKKLEQIQPLSTQDALRRTPGIHAIDTEGFGFYPRITIRGIGSDMSRKVLLLEDGAPIALGPYTDPASYYSPPIERMDRIEVLKGSGSLAFGPSTIGGAINYITRDPEGGRIRLSGGSNNYRNMLAEYGGKWDDKTASISVLRKQGDGWRDMPFELTDIVLKAGMAINDKNFIGVKFTHHDLEGQHTYLGLTQYEYDTNHEQNKAKNDKMYINRNSLDLNHEYDLGNGGSWKNLVYWNNATRDWWRQSHSQSGTPVVTTMGSNSDGRLREFDIVGVDSRLAIPYQALGIKNDLDLGLRLHQEKMQNKRVRALGINDYSINTSYTTGSYTNGVREDDIRKADAIAFFTQNQFHITDATTITPGIRVESYEQKRQIAVWNGATLNTNTKTDNTEVIPGVGVTHKLNNVTTLFAGAHKGFAPPRVQDAISDVGDAVDLEAERSTNYELGIRGKLEKGNYEATLFRLDFKNQIVSQTASGGAGTQNTNAGETLNQGLELSADWHFDSGFIIAANYTWLETAKLDSTRIIGGVDRNGNRLTYAPEHLINTTFGYKTSIWNTNVGYSYVSEQFADLENTKNGSANGRAGILPSYGIWNFNTSFKLANNINLFGAIRNITDKKYIASRAPEGIFPGLGRMIELGIEGRF